jgi:hypothetical protein
MFLSTRFQQLLAGMSTLAVLRGAMNTCLALLGALLSLQHFVLHQDVFELQCSETLLLHCTVRCRAESRHCNCAAQCAGGRWCRAAHLLCNRQQAERAAGSSTFR